MPKIRLTPETLQAKANELEACKDDQRQVIADVATLIHDVVGDWKGKAQEAFIARFDEVKPVYDQFADPDLTEFVHFLNNYAMTMETLDVGHATRAANLNAGNA